MCGIVCLSLSVAMAGNAWAAELFIPSLEMYTVAKDEAGQFSLGSRLSAGFSFVGIKDLSAAIAFSLSSSSVEASMLGSGLDFSLQTARVGMNRLGMLPLSFAYFIGKMENFCSGDDFPAVFGADNIASDFSGYWYFPKGIKNNPDSYYEGIYQPNGTGLAVGVQPVKAFKAQAYIYQDYNVGTNRFSADLRLLLDTSVVKAELFGGYTLPNNAIFRGGLLCYVKAGKVGGFMAQVGVPYFQPSSSSGFSLEHFYFLAEPRFFAGNWMFIPTFFKHPAYYHDELTGEEGVMDFNFKVAYSDKTALPVMGGMEFRVSMDALAASDPFSASVSPFCSLWTGKAEWRSRLTFDCYPYKAYDVLGMFSFNFGVRTEY
jgi:hypothetical protein